MVPHVFLTPVEIQHQTLKQGRGYDREAVDELLEHVTSSYEQVWLQRDELRSRVAELEEELGSFRESERYLRDTLITAQRTADQLRSDAQREADEVRAEAQQEAERVMGDALSDLRQARTEAERELSGLRAQIEQFRTFERDLRANLRAFLEAGLRQAEEAGGPKEPPVVTLVDALSPEAARVERDS
jgi:cell division initiation protein